MRQISILITMMFAMCSSGTDMWQNDTEQESTEQESTGAPQQSPHVKDHLSIGIFTDAHYARKDDSNGRCYQASKQKIHEAVNTFNQNEVDMVISLGDIVDNQYDWYDDIGRYIDRLTMPKYQVLGNHDFVSPFSQDQFDEALKLLGITQRYFSVVRDGFRLIFLDGSDIATHSCSSDSYEYRQAEDMLEVLKDEGEANAKKYNGAIGEKQQRWLEDELKAATEASQTALCFCHIPLSVDGAKKYTLWNGEDMTDLISSYPCAKAVVAGHHHEGGYADDGGIHHITLKGMVLGEQTSYAIIKIFKDKLLIDGFGRENDMEYKFR